MRATLEQRIARYDREINRLKEHERDLRKRKAASERAARNHRLIEAAATIEAEARRLGIDGFEIDAKAAGRMARFWFAHHDPSQDDDAGTGKDEKETDADARRTDAETRENDSTESRAAPGR